MNWVIPEEEMTSAQRKLKRGVEQVGALCWEAAAFEDAKAYLFESERDLRSPQEVVYRCFATQQEPMPLHWPLLAGEAVQNLRAALDHLVYEKSGENERTQFPIFLKPDDFAARAPGMMKGVPEPLRTIIGSYQPYRHIPGVPSQDPLAELRTLSNRDKHKMLATVVSAVTREGVGKPDGVELTWEDFATNKQLEAGRTQISTFVVRAESEVEDAQVEPIFSYEVRIEGHQVDLKWIGNHVYRVVAEVDTGSPCRRSRRIRSRQ